MTRRAHLPGAAELFRPTSVPQSQPGQPGQQAEADQAGLVAEPAGDAARRTGSGRCKHSAKITVYVSDEELLALEQTRLTLRADHGLVVDRGRVVREAVAVLLADFDERGGDSLLVRRLRQEPPR
ncbi:hypothetical protein [Goodfellowiella coeruleoviolacea]|uniref:Cobyrinic acid a,c-diamide synthase n=1 Tax=Goodfellowiella coeruleoviolacea TaxID=334858 RepID=A0AAE3KPP7_9PSEU|nr:hypothetical protein [Goodfellowiella coeruleoviolacea]MCP2170108.1 hypothetical protein [Goodfellowiella coeruleoviolacea]